MSVLAYKSSGDYTAEDVLTTPNSPNMHGGKTDIKNFYDAEQSVNSCLETLSDGVISEDDLLGKPWKGNPRVRDLSPFHFFSQRTMFGGERIRDARNRPVNENDNFYDKLQELVERTNQYLVKQKRDGFEILSLSQRLKGFADNVYLDPNEKRTLLDIAAKYEGRIEQAGIGVRGDSELGKELKDTLVQYQTFLQQLKANGYENKLAEKEALKRTIHNRGSNTFAAGIMTLFALTMGSLYGMFWLENRRSKTEEKEQPYQI
jgi:hypothetical protein